MQSERVWFYVILYDSVHSFDSALKKKFLIDTQCRTIRRVTINKLFIDVPICWVKERAERKVEL